MKCFCTVISILFHCSHQLSGLDLIAEICEGEVHLVRIEPQSDGLLAVCIVCYHSQQSREHSSYTCIVCMLYWLVVHDDWRVYSWCVRPHGIVCLQVTGGSLCLSVCTLVHWDSTMDHVSVTLHLHFIFDSFSATSSAFKSYCHAIWLVCQALLVLSVDSGCRGGRHSWHACHAVALHALRSSDTGTQNYVKVQSLPLEAWWTVVCTVPVQKTSDVKWRL